MISSIKVFAQESAEPVTNLPKLTFLVPGIAYEAAIGKKQTLQGHAYVGFSTSFSSSSSLGTSFNFYVNPGFNVQFRHYYNGEKRAAQGRPTRLNSMNFIGVMYSGLYSKNIISDGYEVYHPKFIGSAGVMWGIQRNYKGKFSLNLAIGPGLAFTHELYYDNNIGDVNTRGVTEFTTVGEITLGIWLKKMKLDK